MRAGVIGWMAVVAAGTAMQARSQGAAAPQRQTVAQRQAEMAYIPAKVPTPRFQGMTLAAVRQAVGLPAKAGGPVALFPFVIPVTGPVDGVVDTQYPTVGTPVTRGAERLLLYMKAANPPLVQSPPTQPPPGKLLTKPVPSLKSDTRDQAVADLERVLMQARFAQPQGDSSWEVVDQSIPPTTPEPRGTVVDVTMGPQVPPLYGLPLSTAIQQLLSRSLLLRVTSGGTKGGPPQTIQSQFPLAGTFVPPGTTVDVGLPVAAPAVVVTPTVVPQPITGPPNYGPEGATGSALQVPTTPQHAEQVVPHPVPQPQPLIAEVPYLYGLREPEAAQSIHRAKLAEGIGDEDGTGAVIWQDPIPGEHVDVGTTVYVKHQQTTPLALLWLLWSAGAGLSIVGGATVYRVLRGRRLLARTEFKPSVDGGTPGVTVQPRVQLELRARPGDVRVTLRQNAAVEKIKRGSKG